MTRLFTLGCSFTAYHYPTWADIAGTAFNYFENWGKPNSGNNYILNSLIELNLRNSLTSDDTVYIMWSGIARQDSYQINEWMCEHNEFDKSGFSCVRGYELLNCAWFSAAQHILENLKVNWKMFSWQSWDTESDVYKIYKPVLDQISAFNYTNQQVYPYVEPIDSTLLYQRDSGADWPSHKDILSGNYSVTEEIQQEINNFFKKVENLKQKTYGQPDLHPSPLTHLKFVEDQLPELNISSETRDWVEHIDQCLLENKPFYFQSSTVRNRL